MRIKAALSLLSEIPIQLMTITSRGRHILLEVIIQVYVQCTSQIQSEMLCIRRPSLVSPSKLLAMVMPQSLAATAQPVHLTGEDRNSLFNGRRHYANKGPRACGTLDSETCFGDNDVDCIHILTR